MKATGIAAVLLMTFFLIFTVACQSGQPSDTSDDGGNGAAAVRETPDEASETPADSDEEDVDVDVDGDGERVVVSDESGTVMTMTEELPDNWPEDVPIMEGYTVIGSSAFEDPANELAMSITASGDAPTDEVADFYENNLPGWTLDNKMTQTGEQKSTVMLFSRDGEQLSISFVEDSLDDEQNSLTIVYMKE